MGSSQIDVGATSKPLMAAAAVLLMIPIVGLLWVAVTRESNRSWRASRSSSGTGSCGCSCAPPARRWRFASFEWRAPGMPPDDRRQLHRAGGARRSVPARHRHGVLGVELAAPERPGEPGRMGARRTSVRRVDYLVPARRRPVHRLHVRGRARRDVRDRRRRRLLRGPLHDHPLPDHLHLHGAPVVGQLPARLRDRRRLRPRALWVEGWRWRYR